MIIPLIIPQKQPGKNCNQYLKLRIFLYITVIAALFICNYVHYHFQELKTHQKDSILSNSVPAMSPTTTDKEKQTAFITLYSLRTDRDPFMPLCEDENDLSATDRGFFIRPIPDKDNTHENSPGFSNINMSVTGIILGGKGYNAIIRDKSGNSHIVSPGEEIRGWKISFITERNVFLLKWNFAAILELENRERLKNKKPLGRLETITL
ncbi:MAG: hypothetical protein K8T10_07365 [Candidatus Eremiobacteraeota bacterium]|nr:hypothetical protein [Candidatus Eremiobacteraeota bacterium]